MKRALTVVGLLACAALLFSAAPARAQGHRVFDSIPDPLPPALPSQPFQAQQTLEFGDLIGLDTNLRHAATATVVMVTWADHASYPNIDPLDADGGWSHPITLNFYNVNATGGVGAKFASIPQTFVIPWRPAADPTCAVPTQWRSPSNNLCYNGYAFKITFDLNLNLPGEFIYGIEFNTQTYGTPPMNASGPYNSLNVGLASAVPSVGFDVDPDAVFWNTLTAGWYTDKGVGGVGTFRQDTGWTGYVIPVQIVAYEVPSSVEDCKKNGWVTLSKSDMTNFKNQGACVSYMVNGN
jgi:hypothetical protein